MGHHVNSKGQVTIPKAMRDALGLVPGTEVTFAAGRDGGMVAPVRGEEAGRERRIAEYRRRIEKVAGSLKGGPSTDEILAMTRGED